MPLALVTGAGIRVGCAIATGLAEAGFDLLLHAHRSAPELEVLARNLREKGRVVETLRADLSDDAMLDGLIETVCERGEPLNVLVNNAGVYGSSDFQTTDRVDLDRMFRINARAPFLLIQGLLPLLKEARDPVVVNITDADVERPYPGYAHYFMSKSSLDMLTRVLAQELAPKIRVNAVAPGTVAYPVGLPQQEREDLRREIPLQSIGRPEDIAKAVVYLVRDGTFVTGQVLRIDGGRTA